jgi:hypothetical protein
MKRRWPLFVALTVLAVVVAVPFLLGAYHRNALERYRASLRASGDFKTLAEATPAPLTDAANGGPAFTDLMTRLPAMPAAIQPVAARGLPPGQRGVTWSQATLPTEHTTNVWPALRIFLTTNGSDLATLRTACDAPVLEFPLRYQDGFEMVLPHLSKARILAQIISADALLQLHDGRPDLALADVRGGVQFVARWNREPLLITQLIRIAIGAIMANSTWELLQFQGWTDADLAALQGAWQELDIPASADRVFDLEQAWKEQASRRLAGEDFDGTQVARGAYSGPSFADIIETCLGDSRAGLEQATDRYPRAWAFQFWRHYQVELVILQQSQAAREACRQAAKSGNWSGPTSKAIATLAALEATLPKLPDYAQMLTNSAASFGSVLSKLASFETKRSLVLAAIALERHRLKHGQYPAQLEQLAPDFLPAVLRDPMDGQPLRYRRNADLTFTLYSVGENARDDGGDPTPTGNPTYGLYGRDSVWPQPASTTEVAAYYRTLIPPSLPPSAGMTGEMQDRFLRRYGIHALGAALAPATNSTASPAPMAGMTPEMQERFERRYGIRAPGAAPTSVTHSTPGPESPSDVTEAMRERSRQRSGSKAPGAALAPPTNSTASPAPTVGMTPEMQKRFERRYGIKAPGAPPTSVTNLTPAQARREP